MAEKRTCEECGAELSANAPQGLCTRCLAKLAVRFARPVAGVPSASTLPSGPQSAVGRNRYFGDYVLGKSLAEIVRDNPLPSKRAAGYVRPLAEAIHYAHQCGILHRDLKPSNVLIDKFNEPRITDFGLAKQLEADSELTATGQLLGSPNYMPSEQADPKCGVLGTPGDDGLTLATGSRAHLIKFWNQTTGQEQPKRLPGQLSQASSLAFSPDGKTLACGSRNNPVWLWAVDEEEPMDARDSPVSRSSMLDLWQPRLDGRSSLATGNRAVSISLLLLAGFRSEKEWKALT